MLTAVVTLFLVGACSGATTPSAGNGGLANSGLAVATNSASSPAPIESSSAPSSGAGRCPIPAIPPGSSPGAAPEPSAPAGLVEATIPTEDGPETIAVGFESVWVAAHRTNTIFRIDPRTNKVVASIPIAIEGENVGVGTVIVGPHGVWVGVAATYADDSPAPSLLFRIEPSHNRLELKKSLPAIGPIVDVTDGLWELTAPETRSPREEIIQVDPASGATLRTVDLGPTPSSPKYVPQVAFGLGSLWAAIADDEIVRVDPADGAVIATIRTPAIPQAYGTFAFAAQHMYFAESDTTLARIDPATNCVDGVVYLGQQMPSPAFGAPPLSVVAAPGGLYVDFDRGALALIDPLTLRIANSVRIDTQNAVGAAAFGFDSMWFPTFGNNTVLRLKPLT